MIPCPACANQISPDAEACPSCGRVNDWVHPILLDVITYLHNRPGLTSFDARGHEMVLQSRSQSLRQKVGLFLFKGSAFCLVGGVFAGWLLSLALMMLIVGGALTLFGLSAFTLQELHIDLRQPNKVKHSSDDGFWRDVLAILQADQDRPETTATGFPGHT